MQSSQTLTVLPERFPLTVEGIWDILKTVIVLENTTKRAIQGHFAQQAAYI
jgi:hypothetical protein